VIHGAETVNLIGYAGASILYDYDLYTYNYEYPNEEIETTNTTYTFGGGPGFDLRFWHLSFNAMFGIRVSTDSNDEVHMDITGETALYYSFD
jgi:outer membrane usher protein FimD/PapC